MRERQAKIRVRVRHGVLEPEQQINLPEGQEVVIVILDTESPVSTPPPEPVRPDAAPTPLPVQPEALLHHEANDDPFADHAAFVAWCARESEAAPDIAEVRERLAKIKGSMAEVVIAERAERG